MEISNLFVQSQNNASFISRLLFTGPEMSLNPWKVAFFIVFLATFVNCDYGYHKPKPKCHTEYKTVYETVYETSYKKAYFLYLFIFLF